MTSPKSSKEKRNCMIPAKILEQIDSEDRGTAYRMGMKAGFQLAQEIYGPVVEALDKCAQPKTWHSPCINCSETIIEHGNYIAREALAAYRAAMSSDDSEEETGGEVMNISLCPLCKSKASIWESKDGQTIYGVTCDKCELTTHLNFDKEEVIRAWNGGYNPRYFSKFKRSQI